MKFVFKHIIPWFIYIVIYIIIEKTWGYFEIRTYGQANPNNIDTVVGIILALSLTFNVMSWMKKKETKNT